jgi:hypothetical protein
MLIEGNETSGAEVVPLSWLAEIVEVIYKWLLKQRARSKPRWMLGPHNGDFEGYYLLWLNAVLSGRSLADVSEAGTLCSGSKRKFRLIAGCSVLTLRKREYFLTIHWKIEPWFLGLPAHSEKVTKMTGFYLYSRQGEELFFSSERPYNTPRVCPTQPPNNVRSIRGLNYFEFICFVRFSESRIKELTAYKCPFKYCHM